MARDTEVKRLTTEIDKILSYKKQELITRPQWGSLSFQDASRDLDRIFDIANHLKILPLEYLADEIVNSIANELSSIKVVFENIDKFNIEAANPASTRTSLVNDVHARADSLFRAASSWIPFLAYQRGDVTKNINQLTEKLKDAQSILDQTKADIQEKSKEIGDIVTKAREASAGAGAAVFTKDFLSESVTSGNRARIWLWATAGLAALTLACAIFMWYFTEAGLDQNQLWQKLTTKLAILVLLLSATAWCAKIYKALMHQSSIHKLRALGLQTFQAFSHAASDNQTKDAVLLQTTKAIFSDAGTGFIDSHSSESDVQFLEIIKSVLPGTEKK